MNLLKKLTSYICQNYKHISENVVRLGEYKKAMKGIHAILSSGLSSCNDNTLTSACERINNLVKLVDEHLNSIEEKIGPMISEGYTSETVEDLEALYIQTNNIILKTANFKEEMIHHVRCAHQCVVIARHCVVIHNATAEVAMEDFIEMLKTWNVQTSQDDDIYCCFALASLSESTVEELDEDARECLKISHWFFFDTFHYWRWRHTTKFVCPYSNWWKGYFNGEHRYVIRGGRDLYRYLCENAKILGDRINDVHTLDLDSMECDIINTNVLSRVHTLDLSRCQGVSDVSSLANVHNLTLINCQGVTDVSALGNVHNLTLNGCEGVTDASALGKVHTLDLSHTGVTDVSMLGNVHRLFLYRCQGVTDVSALGGVHTLYLSMCKGVTDVSALGGVDTLELYGCENVIDVSKLGNVHTLNLAYTGVTDVSALGGVRRLNLRDCQGVTDVSALGGVHKLNLSGCAGVTDVSALGGVDTLDLRWCKNVTGVSALGGVRNLYI